MHHRTKADLIEFEQLIADDFAAGKLPFLIHFSGGNEDQLIKIFDSIHDEDWVLSTHRNHYHYLLKGGKPAALWHKIHGGRSMFVYDKRLNFLTSSILGGLCAVACGLAWQMKEDVIRHVKCAPSATAETGCTDGLIWRCVPRQVWCFLGDGAEDNGHLYEAVMFAVAHDLPVRFIIEDNGYSVDTPTSERTDGFRMAWPPRYVQRYQYLRTFPHAGPGLKSMIQFDPDVVAHHSQPRPELA